MFSCVIYSTVEKKLSVSQDKAKKQLQSYETLIQNYDTTLSDVESYVTWLRNTQELVARQPVIGFNVTQAQDALQQHNVSINPLIPDDALRFLDYSLMHLLVTIFHLSDRAFLCQRMILCL